MFGFKKSQETILWRSEEAAALTGGQNSMPWAATGVAISVDDVRPGDLFFAAHGDDLGAVFTRGAVAAVVPHNMVCAHMPCLKVLNTFDALRSFAHASRFRTHAMMIAVQGEVQRNHIAKVLHQDFDVYESGRHVSQSLAALPDDVRAAVFGFAPSVAPDIAVVTDCNQAMHSRVFQAMPPHGIVIMDETADGYLPCLAAVKANGIQTIVTPQQVLSDPTIIESQAMRVVIEKIARAMVQDVEQIHPEKFAAFRVKSMIDMGRSRTFVLDAAHQYFEHGHSVPDIPKKVHDAHLVYTSKQFSLENSLGRALRMAKTMTPHLRKVVPEVLTPGDYMIFKKPAAEQTIEFSAALRLKKA